MSQITLHNLNTYKQKSEKFAVLTAYDACFAGLMSRSGIDVILVGDSLGMVLQGHDSTLPVSIEDMTYHTQAVAQGNQNSLIMADLPFMTYSNLEQALTNAAKLMAAGAHMVKLEGGAWLADSIKQLKQNGIPCCAHLGLTPQAVNSLGGFKVQGKDKASAEQILQDAQQLEQAGVACLVLECVPAALAKLISETLSIPVIGIGAGPDTDAQVLVLHDLLGISAQSPRFVKDFMAEAGSIEAAIAAYAQAVRAGSFPAAEHCFN